MVRTVGGAGIDQGQCAARQDREHRQGGGDDGGQFHELWDQRPDQDPLNPNRM
jgi:hypothetical protein